MNHGNYEVYINGFTCTNPTWDDVFNGDGFGDEVFFVVNTQVRDGVSGALILPASDATSFVAGDAHGFPNRIQAGSGRDLLGSLRGGFVQGDNYPTPTPWVQDSPANGGNFPPYKIWSGSLVQGDKTVTFLTPTICELDPGASALQGWAQWQVATDQKFGQKAKEVFGGIFPVAKPIFDAVSLGIQTFATLIGIWNPLGNQMTRPIGLLRDPTNPDGTIINPLILALTYETAERLISVDMNGKGAGIFGHRYLDDPQLRGDYQVWFEVRKLQGPPNSTGTRISIWLLDANDRRTAFEEHGPFNGWLPIDCDGNWILWKHDDGRASLWVTDDQGRRVSFKEHGPFPGFIPVSYAEGRILWRHVDGRVSVWNVDQQGNQVSFVEHGPFAGFTGVNCANGNLLWRHDDGHVSLWRLDGQGNRIDFKEHSPPAGFIPVNYSDGKILWRHADGRIFIMKVDASANKVSTAEHGPFAGWEALNVGNNKILWQHVDGRASLWLVDDQCAKVSSTDFGPFPGWTPLHYADSRILWARRV